MVASTSVRESPPPVTRSDRGMPNAAIISPPDSSSDDEDLPEIRGRQIENLKELHEAISQIPQQRASSPTKNSIAKKDASVAGDLLVLPSQASAIAEGMHISFSTGSLNELAVAGNRRFSHARSATEPNVAISESPRSSLTGSEEDSDEEMLRKPQMVRKKSGELVRPALRPPSRRRPSSMPGTPTFSKMVHFDSHLEHVRHFLQVDRPLAVSTGTSPVDNYESDNEYPFGGDQLAAKVPPFEWDIAVTNFPAETPARTALAVRLERVWLSSDQKCLIGSIDVANLAFQKTVTCRFTLDYWKTTSEVAAEYMCEIQPAQKPVGHDRFNFTIKLSDTANLESKTLYFCIRYTVNGHEYWDNNGGCNFQVDFRKKMLPQNGKKGVIGAASRPANGLPKSTRRLTPPAVSKPKVPGTVGDDFGTGPKPSFDQSIHDYLGESGPTSLRLKGVRTSANLASDNLSSRLSAPSGQAFANRYDFGASLTAAIQTAKDTLTGKPDGLYMKPNRRPAMPVVNTSSDTVRPGPTAKSAPVKPTINADGDSPSPSIATASYEELVNKYCFDGGLRPGRFDGPEDAASKSTTSSSTASSDGSPVQMGNYHHSHSGIQHHSLHPLDPNPYFHHATSFIPIGASPSESPLTSFSSQRTGSPLTTQSGQVAGRSSSPATLVGSFGPFAGTSPNEYPYQHLHDRFPFSSADAHSATAIRG
ncbi:putative phosphatase regulatory subunit-domain-containing protein [Lasiosphaeria miniovina]|uniref:Phosphatase regulatory subunit-domain-containing protein n=1 Tax=Lasiosphaeria miniovina TaxID=1954250 RepID=A0AA40AKK0_9PEZI|nr:putative phosphatase regulatory subunit-domain-containing protein [Lasiosphaeria miniovina]KAK0717480.1 putative phosphatase regulatory subunit-domain-containing protein [Lasiosphaeria miniovina]